MHRALSHESLCYIKYESPLPATAVVRLTFRWYGPVIYYLNRTEIRDVHAQSVSWKRNARAVQFDVYCTTLRIIIIIFIYYLVAGGDACALIPTRRVSFPIRSQRRQDETRFTRRETRTRHNTKGNAAPTKDYFPAVSTRV